MYLKNIHSRLKNSNNAFKFTSVLENNKTIDNEPFEREVIYYKSFDNSRDINIAITFESDFMLNRMAADKHIHIDPTFIHFPNFMQILVILI